MLTATPPYLLSPSVLAELDYLLAKRVGRHARDALLAEVERSAYQLEPFTAEDVAMARDVLTRFGDLDVGLTDASLVVLADRYGISDILTLDVRHFRALRRSDGASFRLLPEDADPN